MLIVCTFTFILDYIKFLRARVRYFNFCISSFHIIIKVAIKFTFKPNMKMKLLFIILQFYPHRWCHHIIFLPLKKIRHSSCNDLGHLPIYLYIPGPSLSHASYTSTKGFFCANIICESAQKLGISVYVLHVLLISLSPTLFS